MPTAKRVFAVLIALVLLPMAVLVPASSASAAPAGLTAAFQATGSGSTWDGKYVISNNTGADITGWTLEFDLPPGVTVSNVWYGKLSQNGNHVTIINEYYNARVGAGRNTEPYSPSFRISTGTAPPGCKINGNNCDGTPDTPPKAPENLRATGSTTKTVALAWDKAVAGDNPIASYEVYSGGSNVASTTDTKTVVTGLSPNKEYSFTVQALDTKGNKSGHSKPVTATTLDPSDDTTPPTAPKGLRSTGTTSDSVGLSWDAASDASGIAGYDVYRDGKLATSVTGTSATVSGLAPVTEYSFTVRARDTYDNISSDSAAVKATTDDVIGGGSHARVGYFVQWGIYGRQYFVRNLDTSGAAAKLTHINYAFSNIHPTNLTCMNGVTKGTTPNPQDPDQGTGAGDAEADYGRAFSAGQSVDGKADTGWEPLRGNFNQLRKLKAKHPHLKVMMSIGGWTYSKFFSDVAATDASRKKFVSSCVDMYLKGNLPTYNGAGGPGSGTGVFDGFDLDWEWPGAEGHAGNHISDKDKANNTLLFAEFRRQMDALSQQTGEEYELTAFTPADPAKIEAGWDITTNDGNPSVFDYMDFANVQGYDFHGAGSDNSWEPNRTGHASNQWVDDQDPYNNHFSNEVAIQEYLDAGVNPRKLTIGLPFYGRGWQGVTDGGVHGEWQAANGAAPGQFAEEAGTRGYANLKASVPGCTVHHDEQSLSTYCYTGNGGQWWTFDDPWSIERKTAWVKEQNLLGMMIWEMSGDNGTLMTAVDTGLG
ncbi:glycosyl hydrolase family 18 protein [Stackebrandtia nassauensis]|uniref:chitinase n=1 Tax=Stackebrandtia nassauensis (strain DSM 44728 / CIP 108903 / NRRL B-16338 / NBRC 102104 / LLR-40K-21) TaxID=446470 RepID=D3Q278_STANL|nr:glycosyl hydrolase family 18 protein [Stackebrandtia nassauensis]ADD43811.1 glycoside hydrolase family 18 [Stackebrandtia nassauensis DSM 44728]